MALYIFADKQNSNGLFKVIFLHQGQVLAEGSIDQITADKHLTEIYFWF